jgi:hypothetical protein
MQLVNVVLVKYLNGPTILFLRFCIFTVRSCESFNDRGILQKKVTLGREPYFFVCLCLGWHMFLLEVHTPYIHGDRFDCDVICSPCGMLQFCCTGNSFMVL